MTRNGLDSHALVPRVQHVARRTIEIHAWRDRTAAACAPIDGLVTALVQDSAKRPNINRNWAADVLQGAALTEVLKQNSGPWRKAGLRLSVSIS